MSAQLLQFPARQQPWFAMHVLPNREFRVRERLEAAGIESYLPTRMRKGWRNTTVECPMFPGYVFARFNYIDLYTLFRVTRWVLRVIGDYRGPVEIPAVQIETLRTVLQQAEIIVLPIDKWKGGEEVEVQSGPLKGARGTVAFVKNQTRLVISVPMLGRCVSTELDADTVQELVALPKAA